MKLIYIANARIPTEKAHGLQIVKTCEAFVINGLEVELIVPRVKNAIKEDAFSYYNLKRKFRIDKIFLIKLFGYNRIGLYIQRFTFSISAFLFVLFKKFDIVYIRQDLLAYFLLSLFKKKVIYENHEPKKRFLWFYKWIIKKVKKKVLVAFKLAELYNQWGADKSSYVIAPNGVDLDEFNNIKANKLVFKNKLNISEKDKVVLYLGHFYKWKGVYILVDSMKYLVNNVKIVLIGGTKSDQFAVKQYLDKNNIKNVFIHDFVPHHGVIEYLKSADILVLPNTAKEERSAKYTTPIKLFEYLASGVPIVASRLDSFSAYLQDHKNSILFEPDNAEDLAKKIKLILSGNNLANSISRQAAEDVREYTWTNRAKKIIKFIDN